MKTLEKDRARRYETANELAHDVLGRGLDDGRDRGSRGRLGGWSGSGLDGRGRSGLFFHLDLDARFEVVQPFLQLIFLEFALD